MTKYWIYHLSLTSCSVLLFAFSFILLFSVKAKGDDYKDFNKSQLILGRTLLLWACYMSIHNIFSLRFTNNYLAQTVSLSTYLFLMNGFEMALHTMLDRNYNLKRRTKIITAECSVYAIALTCNYFFVPKQYHDLSILIFAAPLLIKIIFAARSAHKRYVDVKNNLDNYYSDDTSESVEWIRNYIYLMLAVGFSCIFLPYGTALSDTVMTIVGMFVITYMIISNNNFFIATVMAKPFIKEMDNHQSVGTISKLKHQQTKNALDKWIKTHRFIEPGITIEDVANDIQSNRTYISEYLNQSLDMNFRNWISLQRIEYSKSLLLEHPDYTTIQIAEMVGYARSSYNKAFAKITGQSPSAYRQNPQS